MNKVSARKKLGKQRARNSPKPGTTPVDRRLLAQAVQEDGEAVVLNAAERDLDVLKQVAAERGGSSC